MFKSSTTVFFVVNILLLLAHNCASQKSSSADVQFELCASNLGTADLSGLGVTKGSYTAPPSDVKACVKREDMETPKLSDSKNENQLDMTEPVVFSSPDPYLNGVFVFEGTVGDFPVYFNYNANRKLHRIDSLWAVSDEQRVLAFAEADVKHPGSISQHEDWTVSRRSGITTAVSHVRPLKIGHDVMFDMEAPVLAVVDGELGDDCYRLRFEWVSVKDPHSSTKACDIGHVEVGSMAPYTFNFRHRGEITARNGMDYVVHLSEDEAHNGPFVGSWYNVLEEDLLVAT